MAKLVNSLAVQPPVGVSSFHFISVHRLSHFWIVIFIVHIIGCLAMQLSCHTGHSKAKQSKATTTTKKWAILRVSLPSKLKWAIQLFGSTEDRWKRETKSRHLPVAFNIFLRMLRDRSVATAKNVSDIVEWAAIFRFYVLHNQFQAFTLMFRPICNSNTLLCCRTHKFTWSGMHNEYIQNADVYVDGIFYCCCCCCCRHRCCILHNINYIFQFI